MKILHYTVQYILKNSENIMKYIAGCIIGLALLSGCMEPRTVVGTEYLTVKLVDYDPPKHFYVHLEVIGTNSTAPYRTEVGTHFESVYVSKHCSGISKDRIGTVFTIQALRYKTDPNDPEIKYDFDSDTIRREFCR